MSNHSFPDDEWKHISNSISALITTIGSMQKGPRSDVNKACKNTPGRFIPMKKCPKCYESPPSTLTSLSETISSLETFTSDFIDSTYTTSSISFKRQQLEDNKLIKNGTPTLKNRSSQLSTVAKTTPSPILNTDVTLIEIGEHHRALATSLNNFLNKLKQSTKALTNLTAGCNYERTDLEDEKFDLSVIEELSAQLSELTPRSSAITKPVSNYKATGFPNSITPATSTGYASNGNFLSPTFYSQTYQPKCDQISSISKNHNGQNYHNIEGVSQVDDCNSPGPSKKKHDRSTSRKKKCHSANTCAKPKKNNVAQYETHYHQNTQDQSKPGHANNTNCVLDLPVSTLEQKLTRSSSKKIKHSHDSSSNFKTDLEVYKTGDIQNEKDDEAHQTVRVPSRTGLEEKPQSSQTRVINSIIKKSKCVANSSREKHTKLRSKKRKRIKTTDTHSQFQTSESELGNTAVDENTDTESYPISEDKSNTLRSKHRNYTSDSYARSQSSTVKKVNSDLTTSLSSDNLPPRRKRHISSTKKRSNGTEKRSRILAIVKDKTNDSSYKSNTHSSKHVSFTSDTIRKSQIPLPQRTNSNLTPKTYIGGPSQPTRALSTPRENKQNLKETRDLSEQVANKESSVEDKPRSQNIKVRQETFCSESISYAPTTFRELQSVHKVNSDATISVSYNTIAPEQKRVRSTSEGREKTYKYSTFQAINTARTNDKDDQNIKQRDQPQMPPRRNTSDSVTRRSYIPVLNQQKRARSTSLPRKQNLKYTENQLDLKTANARHEEDTLRDEMDDTTLADDLSKILSTHNGFNLQACLEKDTRQFSKEGKNTVNDKHDVKSTDKNYQSVKGQHDALGSKRNSLNSGSFSKPKSPTREVDSDLATTGLCTAVSTQPKRTRSISKERSNNLSYSNNQSGQNLNKKVKEIDVSNSIDDQHYQHGDQSHKLPPKHIKLTSQLPKQSQLLQNGTKSKCALEEKRMEQSAEIRTNMISDTYKEVRSWTGNSQHNAENETNAGNNQNIINQSDTPRSKVNNLNSNSFNRSKPPIIREVNSELAPPRRYNSTTSQRKRTRSTSRERSNPIYANDHSNSQKAKPNEKDRSDDWHCQYKDSQSDKPPLKYVSFVSDSEKFYCQPLLTRTINPALTTYKCYNVVSHQEEHDRSATTEEKRQNNHNIINSEFQNAGGRQSEEFAEESGKPDQHFQMFEELVDVLCPECEDLPEVLQFVPICETKSAVEEDHNLIYRDDDPNLYKKDQRDYSGNHKISDNHPDTFDSHRANFTFLLSKKPLSSSEHKNNYELVASSSCSIQNSKTKLPKSISQNQKQHYNTVSNVTGVPIDKENHNLNDNTSIEGQYYISPLSGTSFNSDSSNKPQKPFIFENNPDLAAFECRVTLPKVKRIRSVSQERAYDQFYTEILPIPRFANAQKRREAGRKNRVVKPTNDSSNKPGVEESKLSSTFMKTVQLFSSHKTDSKTMTSKHYYTPSPHLDKGQRKKCEMVYNGNQNYFEDLQQRRNNTNSNVNQSDVRLSKPITPKQKAVPSSPKTNSGKKKVLTNFTDNKPDSSKVRQRIAVGDEKSNANINKNHFKVTSLNKTRLPSNQRTKSILAKYLNTPPPPPFAEQRRQIKKKNYETASNERCASRQGADVNSKKRDPNVTKNQSYKLPKLFSSALAASKCRGNSTYIPKCARPHSEEKKFDQSGARDLLKGNCKNPKNQAWINHCNNIFKSFKTPPPSPKGEANTSKRLAHTPEHLPVSSSIGNISSLNRKATPVSREKKHESNITNAHPDTQNLQQLKNTKPTLNDSQFNKITQPTIAKQKNENSIICKNISTAQQRNNALHNYIRLRREGYDPNQSKDPKKFEPIDKEQKNKPGLNSLEMCSSKYLKLPGRTTKNDNKLKINSSSGNLDLFKRRSNTYKLGNFKTGALFEKPSYCTNIWIPNFLQFDTSNERYFLDKKGSANTPTLRYPFHNCRSTPCFQTNEAVQIQENPEISISNYNSFIASNAKSMLSQHVAPDMHLSSQFIVLSLHSIKKNPKQKKSTKQPKMSTCDGTHCSISKPTCPGTTTRKSPDAHRVIESSSSDSLILPGKLKKENQKHLPEAIKSAIASSHASLVKDLVTELDQGAEAPESKIEEPKYEPDIIQRVMHNISTNFEAADRIQNLLDELEYEQERLNEELLCTCRMPSGCSTSRCRRHDCSAEREREKMKRKPRGHNHVGYDDGGPSDDNAPRESPSKPEKRGTCATCWKADKKKD